jgi:CHAT domain-containing protein
VVATGGAADEATFKRLAPGRRVIHLATHGFFLDLRCAPGGEGGTRGVMGLVPAASGPEPSSPPGENPLLLSGLALAGANLRDQAEAGDEDGVLTADEIAALDLSGTEWAVLSACGTGLGEVAAGEGVLGLRRAFLAAGTRTVFTSLWSVRDKPTREWMAALYRHRLLDGAGTAEAARAASLDLLRSRRAQGRSTHPFEWAAFLAAGDWR